MPPSVAPSIAAAVRRGVPLAATIAGLLAAASPAGAALSTFAPPAAGTSFPAFYQDATGLQLQVCPAGTANCIVAPATPPIPSTYSSFDARFLTAGPAHNGRIDVRDFLAGVMGVPGGPNAAGAPPQAITENKLVVTGGGLAPNSTYTIAYPFGTVTAFTDGSGSIGRGPASVLDFAGCLAIAAPIPPPCDFGLALGGVMGPFLRQDPHSAVPPAGFVGNSLLQERFVGSPVGQNFVRIDGPDAGGVGVNSIATDTAFITGQLAPGAPVTPLASAPLSAELGSSLPGTLAGTKTITVSNDATVPLALTTVTLAGANAGDFAIAPTGTCPLAGGTVAPAPAAPGRCTVDVTLTPSAVGSRSATLRIGTNVATGPLTVALTGAGTAPVLPAAPAPAQPPTRLTSPAAVGSPTLALPSITVPRSAKLRSARHSGLRVSVTVPAGANVVRIRLMRGSRIIQQTLRAVTRNGVVSLTVPSSRKARRALKRGTYTLLVTPGTSATNLDATAKRSISIR